MKITTPLNDNMLLQLNAAEAHLVLKALVHTQRRFFPASQMRFIDEVAAGIEARLSCLVQIRKHEDEPGLPRVGLV